MDRNNLDNIKDLEKQNRHLLWMLMEFDIHRYLISNTKGRCDGYEKAQRHINLSATFLASKKMCSMENARTRLWDECSEIHDATTHLTSYLDSEIGFPIDEQEIDYDLFSRKFFDRFIELAENFWVNKQKGIK